MSQPEPLPLETYARALAHLLRRRGEPVREVLASIDLTPEAFSQAEQHWTGELAESLTRRKGVLAMTFASALAQAQRQVGLLDPAAGEAPPVAWTAPATAAQAKADVPSFLRAEQAPIAPLPTPSPAVPPPEPVREAPAAPQAPPAAPPALVVPMPKVVPPPAALASTADVNLREIVDAVMRGALPFAKSEQPSAAAIAEAPAKAQGAPPPERNTGTLQADYRAVVAAVDQGSLPFARMEPASAGPSTGAAGAEPDFALLPLETYASVSGALARGEARADVLARHGLRAEVFDRLAMAWAQRFQREPHLLARFKELARGGATGKRGE